MGLIVSLGKIAYPQEFTHACQNLSFLRQNNIPLYVCACIWLPPSFVDGSLDRFPRCGCRNDGAVSMGIKIAAFENVLRVLLGRYRNGTAGSCVNSIFNF